MEFEKQINAIEKGKQIGYSFLTDSYAYECGIQKKDGKYLVYFAFYDFEYDHMPPGKKEFYSFSDLSKAIDYIVSREFPFEEFFTRKGNKMFYTEYFNEENTVVVE